MTKDFVTVTPDSGSKNGSIEVEATPNISYDVRSTSVKGTAGTASTSMIITQTGMIIPCIQDFNQPALFCSIYGTIEYTKGIMRYKTLLTSFGEMNICVLGSTDTIAALNSSGYEFYIKINNTGMTELRRQGGGEGFNNTDAFLHTIRSGITEGTKITYLIKSPTDSQPVPFAECTLTVNPI